MDETGLEKGLEDELWMNRAVFVAFGIWPSADGTANGRLIKNAMIVVSICTGYRRCLIDDAEVAGETEEYLKRRR